MNDEKQTTKRKRYDDAFKQAAVEHWMSSGKAAKAVAAELGVNVQSLMQWKQRLCPLPTARNGVRTLDVVEAENRRLRREVESLVRQREILKKTLGIISAPSGSVLNG
jgi:transposase-like protein